MQNLVRSKTIGVTGNGGRGTAGAGPGRDLLYNVYGVVIAVHTRGQVYITEPQEGQVLIPEPIELELDHHHYAARVGPAQEPSPPVVPSPDPEPEVVDLSLEDDALLDTPC